jgi:uncharacterized protein (DUF983 family)
VPAPVMNSPIFAREALPPAFRPPPRAVWPAIRKGLLGLCATCGAGRIFRAYHKVNDECPQCGAELHHHRADDAPPYNDDRHCRPCHCRLSGCSRPILARCAVVAARGDMADPCARHLLVAVAGHEGGGLIAYQWALRMHGFEHARRFESALGGSGSK